MEKSIFLVSPITQEQELVRTLVSAAVEIADGSAKLFRTDEMSGTGYILDQIFKSIETSDLIICDITGSNPNVMYQLGFAHALSRPVILISGRPEDTPFDVRSVRTVMYDLTRPTQDFLGRLSTQVSEALENPDLFSMRPHEEPTISNVFISYSHRDTDFLTRLMVHLKPLEREGLIEAWADTRLKAGDKWKSEIEQALEKARVAILLVTADFLASEFVVENELPPILANAESKGTRIIPVVLKPCRFSRDRNLNIFQSVNDPNAPLVSLPEAEQEKIYDQISAEVERAMG